MSKRKKKVTVREAVRMIGCLLETNGTSQVFAKTKSDKGTMWDNHKACKFCLQGAIDLISTKVLGPTVDGALDDAVEKRLQSFDTLVRSWDCSTRTERKEIIRRLKTA